MQYLKWEHEYAAFDFPHVSYVLPYTVPNETFLIFAASNIINIKAESQT